ncbi:hypothetical protein CPC16_006798 [Podila verticillata]|uniref:Uncharacterized protein n=1 Tax=Podila verticillata NRRL 6337 TaxID=1069443 RepID=A0A086TKJ2_9FUNG|nr:hypothetical protein BGZ52_004791 [Haplosporangium bisporale]KAF9216935.1 hypothetical protein BGZ59_007326 [Podila verticillata]KAF9387899.1 hypothetical protein CPC16_006798 [Podila verticillata]KAI9231655.1 MAG: GPR1/FUN34/yaaH family-domain-containing protein [Podila humilis]KFH62469.1 hypothetical protein MVEG_11678 [Podila verticillata NRRL 6337]
MSTAHDTYDLEKQHKLVDHPMHRLSQQSIQASHSQQIQQHQTQQQLPLHAHLEPEDVRVSPFQMDVNMNTPLNVLQSSTPPPNPGPFGLCAFALTAFCMGLYNLRAGVDPNAPGNFITGTAMFYGGLGQVIAGLLEYRNGNTFGGTTFCSYGLYWISYATLLIPSFGVAAAYADFPEDYMTAVGTYLLGWTIFTFLMWTLTWKSNLASSLLFFCLGMTYLFSTISSLAHLAPGNVVGRIGGGMGLITSSIAWYCAMADLSNSSNSYYTLPLGQLGRR